MADVDVLSGGGLLGHLQEFRDRPLDLLRRLNREQGELGRLRFASVSVLVVNTPALVHELLVEKHAHFQKSRVLRAGLYPLAGDGLFTSEGELWRRQRKLMAPIFQARRIADFDACMVDCAELVIDRWAEGDTLDALHETTAIAMNVASRALFGIDISAEGDELGQALTVALEWVAHVVTSLPFAVQIELAEGIHKAGSHLPDALSSAAERIVEQLEHPIMWPTAKNREMQAALETLEARVAKMIAERRADPQPRRDLLSLLLHAHEETGDAAMSDRQLRDEILTLFVAGHETTATALAWSLYLLSRHPEVRDAVEREAADVLGDRRPTAADLPRLELATRVFKEALRMYPPVPVYERQATQPVEIGGLALDDGDYVAVLPWALHHREALWPEPDRFDPDRFLPEAEAARARYAWVPFGAGPRVCIGSHFALQEGPLVLAMIARRARLELVDGREIEPDPHSATLRPRGGVPVRVTRRPS
jgi:cytochrome P450